MAFVSDRPSGEVKVSLPNQATLADAGAALTLRLETRGDLLKFRAIEAVAKN
jgi:hypothetical protein